MDARRGFHSHYTQREVGRPALHLVEGTGLFLLYMKRAKGHLWAHSDWLKTS